MFELIVIFWIIAGLFAYADHMAHFQRRFPLIAPSTFYDDRSTALLFALTGPIALLITLFEDQFKYGFWFVWSYPYTEEE